MANGNLALKLTIQADGTALVQATQQGVRGLKDVGDQAGRTSVQIRGVGEANSKVTASFSDIGKGAVVFTAVASLASRAASAVAQLPRAGIGFAAEIETAQLGIAGVLTSMTEVNGQATQFVQAQGIASTITKQLADDAARTAANTTELVGAFQALVGPGLAAGMAVQQIRELAVTGVSAVKALGLEQRQVVQELRDLVQGGITASSSTLATALGLKDSDIAKARSSADGLFNFLTARLKGFEQASDAFANTFSGRLQALQEQATRSSASALAPVIAEIGNQAAALTQVLKDDSGVRTLEGLASAAALGARAVGELVRLGLEYSGVLGTLATAYVGLKLGGVVASLAEKARVTGQASEASRLAAVTAAAEGQASAAVAQTTRQEIATKIAGLQATVSATQGERTLAQAKVASLQNHAASIAQARVAAQVQLQEANTTQRAALAIGAHSAALAAARQAAGQRAAALRELASLGAAQVAVERQLTAAQVASQAAANNATTAVQRLTAAKGAAGVAAGAAAAAGRGFSAVIGALGGPVGIAITAVTLLIGKLVQMRAEAARAAGANLSEERVRTALDNNQPVDDFDLGGLNTGINELKQRRDALELDFRKLRDQGLAATDAVALATVTAAGGIDTTASFAADQLQGHIDQLARLDAEIKSKSELTKRAADAANAATSGIGLNAAQSGKALAGLLEDVKTATGLREKARQQTVAITAATTREVAAMRQRNASSSEIATVEARSAEAVKAIQTKLNSDLKSLNEQGASDAKAIAEGRFAVTKAVAEQVAEIERNTLALFSKANEAAYAKGTLDAAAYYAERARLQTADLDLQEKALTAELVAAQAAAQSARKTEDKARAQARVVEITTKLIELGRERLQVDGPEEIATREWEAYATAAEKRYQQAADGADALATELRNLEFEGALIGQTAEAVRALMLVRAEQAAQELERQALVARGIDLDGEAAKKLQDQADTVRRIAQQKNTNAVAQQVAEVAERIESNFRDSFLRLTEGGKGTWKAFTRSLFGTFKTEVADQIYKAFLKPFVVKVIGSFLGMDAASAGVPGAEGGGSGIAGTASNLYSLASSASSLVTIGSQVAAGTMSLANAAGTYFANATNSGISGLLATNGAYGTAAGAGGASGLAGYGAGLGIALVGAIAGNIISGGYSAIGKNPNAAIGIGAAIGSIVPGIGTAIGAAIGAVIGGLVNRFFGRKLTETGIKGTFDASGFNGVNYTYEKGGLFRSDREREQGLVDNETTNLLNQAFGAVKNSVAGLAAQLGVGRQAIDGFTTNVRLNFKGLDEAGISKLLDDTLSGIGNQLADAVLAQTAGLKELAIRGETSVQTLGRLAEFITTVNGVVDFLNIGLFDLSVTGVKAAQSFVELFGGLENFDRVTGVYYENFFSATEKQAINLQRVATALNQLDLAGAFVDTAVEFQRLVVDPTRDNFRDLVQAQNVNTETGRNTTVALLGLAGAVAEVLPASQAATVSLQSLADKFLGVADRLLDGTALQAARVARIQATLAAGGVNLSADQVRSLTRSQVLTGYEQALALGAPGAADAILSVVDSLAELNPVAFAAASAVTVQGDAMNILAARREIEIEIMRLSGNEVGALARERQTELAALDPSLRAIKAQAYALRDAKAAQEAYTDAVEKAQKTLDDAISKRETAQGKVDQAVDAVQAVRDRGTQAYINAQQQLASAQQRVLDLTRESAEAYRSSADSLRGYLRELAGSDAGSNTGPQQLAARRNEFNATYQAALGGDQAAYDSIQAVASNFLQASRDNNAQFSAYRADDVQVRMALARLADIAATRAAAGGAVASVDPVVQAQLDLTAATTALAKAHADATAIGASLVAQQDNLVAEFAEAQAALAIANAQLAAAGTEVGALQAVLNAIQLNTAATATNIAGLPDAIAAIGAQANLEVGALIRFIADSTGLPADLRELATSTARTIGRTIDFVGNATGLPTDLRTLALATSSGFVKTVNYLVGSVLTEDLKRIALTQTDTLTKTVSAVLDSTTPAALQSLILNQAGLYQATVSAVAASGLDPALQRVLFTGTGDYVTRITSVIDSALSAEQRALLLTANTTALRSVTLSATLGAALSADQQKLLNQANESVTKVLTQSVASGFLSDDQVRVLHQANEAVSKVVQASVSSNSLTADQSAILRAVTGTAVGTVNVSANVAFNSSDPLQSIFNAISGNTSQAVQIATIQTQELARRLDLIASHTGNVDSRSQGGGLVVRTATQAGPLQYFAKGGLVNSPTLFSDGGRPSIAGEAGGEWILPAVRMPNGDMGVQALAPDYGLLQAPDGGMRAVIEELRAMRRENQQLRDEVAGLRTDQQTIGVRTIESAGKTADTLRKWDIAGQPPARAVPAEA